MPLAKAQASLMSEDQYFPIMTLKYATAYPCYCLFSLKIGLWLGVTLSRFLGAICLWSQDQPFAVRVSTEDRACTLTQ